MRKLLIIPALLLICSFVFAGENDMNNITANPSLPEFFPRFNIGVGSGNAAPATQLRLVAKSKYIFKNNYFQEVDSTTYSYSNNRGSVPNADDMNNDEHIVFDLSTTYLFNTTTGSYEPQREREQKFQNNNVTVLIYKIWDKLASVWENHLKYEYAYDKDGKMEASKLRRWQSGIWMQDINSFIVYDNSNKVIEMNSVTQNVDFYYDMNSNLKTVEDEKWNSTLKTWVKNERKTYSYSSNSDITEYILQRWIGNNWTNEERTEYQYDGNSNVTAMILYKWVNGTWARDTKHTYAYDSNNNMLEDVTLYWNPSISAYTELSREVRIYNSQSLVESLITYSWTGTNWTHKTDDINIKYYYEYYNPSSIPTTINIGDIAIYPIPASDQVNLDVHMNNMEKFSISIVDMSGKLMYYKDETPASNTSEIIPVHNFSSGNYLISVNSGSERYIQKLVVYH